MPKSILAFAFFLLTFKGMAQQTNLEKIDWPIEYEPIKSNFFVHNEININASASDIWSILIDALQWESWYKGAKYVSYSKSTDTLLHRNVTFSWETMGLKFNSTVRQFIPNKLLAWESKKKSIKGYHVWLLIPTENGCKVITEESQHGWLTFFEKIFQPKKLKRLHDSWLTELKRISESKK